MTGWSDGLSVHELQQKLLEDEELLGKVTEHKQALEEILKARRHTHATIDGLECAISLIVRIMVREEMASRLREADLRELSAVLGRVRQGPTAYREDHHSRQRPELSEMVDEFLAEWESPKGGKR